MDRLQVELSKQLKVVTKAARKLTEVDYVSITHNNYPSARTTSVYVWYDDDITFNVQMYGTPSTKQIVQAVQKELRRKEFEDFPL